MHFKKVHIIPQSNNLLKGNVSTLSLEQIWVVSHIKQPSSKGSNGTDSCTPWVHICIQGVMGQYVAALLKKSMKLTMQALGIKLGTENVCTLDGWEES